MNNYHPHINTAAHSLEWLQKRRDVLARIGLGGSAPEKKSTQRKAELRAIEAGIRAKGSRPQLIARPREVGQPSPGDTALMQPHARIVAPISQGVRGYSAAMGRVETDFAPNKYDRYI